MRIRYLLWLMLLCVPAMAQVRFDQIAPPSGCTNGQVPTWNAPSFVWTCTTPTGTGGSPGGSDTQVQFNDATAFGGIPSVTYIKATPVLKIQAGAKFLFTDPTDTTKAIQLDLSGIATGTTRTGTLPNANFTFVVPFTCTNQVATAASASGTFTCNTITSAYTSGTFPATAHALLSTTHSDTTAAAVSRGAGIFGIGASSTWQLVAAPSVTGGYFKKNASGDIIPSTLAASGTGSPTACSNQVVTAFTLVADAAPTSTCATVTSAFTSGTFAPNAHSLLGASHSDTLAHAVVLGDMLFGNGTPAWAALAGNITGTKKFLTQTGTGAVSAAPAWGTILGTDLPTPAAASLGGVDSKDCTGTGHVLSVNTDGSITCSADAGGGSGSPGGVNTNVQFNDSGSFGGDPGLVYDKVSDVLSVGSIPTFLQTFNWATQTANRTVTWPDSVGPGVPTMDVSGNVHYEPGLTPFTYGAKADVVTIGPSTTDAQSKAGTFVTGSCSITAASSTLTCTGANFTAADVGKPIVVSGAGATTPNPPCTVSLPCALVTTISGFTDATHVTLTATATTTVASNALTFYGTDDFSAISSCIGAGTMLGGRCTLSNGAAFMVSRASSTINFYALGPNNPPDGGVLDGTGTILFAPQGTLTGATNDRLFYIISNSSNPMQVAGNAKYTIAASGATQSGSTVTITTTVAYGADIAVGRCLYITGNSVAGYNGPVGAVATTPTGTTFTFTSLVTGLGTGSGGSVHTSICKGDTTFTATNSSDAATLTPGQWIILRERDPAATDIVYADWEQVASVAGAVVTVNTPFRMQFPNARTWNVSGSPAPCTVGGACGLGFTAITSLTQNLTLKDFTILIPKIASTNLALAVAITSTRGIRMVNTICVNASQNCVFNYQAQGTITTGNYINNAAASEQAADVDSITEGNNIYSGGTAVFGATFTPQGQCWLLDYGSGFGIYSNNLHGACLNQGMGTLHGLHDSSIVGNTFGWIFPSSGGSCIGIRGSARNRIDGNICTGGGTATQGITISDDNTATVPILSDSNTATNNVINNFPSGAYSCGGNVLNTDTCSDNISASRQGVQIGAPVPNSSAMLQLGGNSAIINPAIAFMDFNPSAGGKKVMCGAGILGPSAFSCRDITGTAQSFFDYFYATPELQFPVAADKVGQASNTSASSAINTTDTIIVKTPALAASRLLAGTVIRIVLVGTCTSTAANISTFTVRWGTNGTTADGTVAAIATSVAATSGTNTGFKAVIDLTVRTVGASATSEADMDLESDGNIGIVATQNVKLVAGTAFNTTTANGILSVSYKSAATTTTSTFQEAFIEFIYK
jgi:hypothetical protein